MSSDWDEIKRLAADFQKAQLTSTLQKLSERNCIEIVTLLLNKNLLDVFFTIDGKEYITPKHLEHEILDELYVQGGRVNLVEISKTLNVDLSRVEDISKIIANNNTDIYFMLGQLIDETYIANIAQEINEKLSQNGQISISDLAAQFDLPSDFLQHDVVEKHLGKIIRGRQDPSNPRIFFTQAYIQHCKAKTRGALAAITKPTNVSTILQQINVPEKIFHSLIDELSPAGYVTSKMTNAQYVPYIYAKRQSEWVTSFYKQNGFLEYDAMSKLGITEPKQFLRKSFPNDDIIYLKRCAIGPKIIDLSVLTSLNECNITKSYLDLTTILPSSINEEDIEEMYNLLLTKKGITPSQFVYMEGIVFSQQFLADLIKPCNDVAHENAKKAVESGVFQKYLADKQTAHKTNAVSQEFDDDTKLDKREERRKKAASGKAGGGSQGRETKTKSTKKHQRGGRNAATNIESDDECETKSTGNKKASKTLELVSCKEIIGIIKQKLLDEDLEHLAPAIVNRYHDQLNQIAIAKAQDLFAATPQTNRRQTHAAVQDKLNVLLVDLRLYDKGSKLFPPEVQSRLVNYLLKSLGNDICNEITGYIANEFNLTLKSTNLNVEQRNKIAQECEPEYKNALIELNKSINKSVDDFIAAIEAILKVCSMIIKKVDKKKDRQLIMQHKEKLLQQLNETADPALALHLTSLILFTTITGCILHASGKFVSSILTFIRSGMNNEQNNLLMKYHDLVLAKLQTNDDHAKALTIDEQLEELQEKTKQLAATFEKPGVFKAD